MVESVKPIRTALRTLRVLAELNVRAPASAAEVARALGMARATAYRFLETLVDSGFVAKDRKDGRYRPTHLVRTLSCGFEDENWLVECARPEIRKLGEELVWPIAISTISGPGMLLRESTDAESPLAINRFTPGRRVSLVGTASGRIYLAYCSHDQRETLLDMLRHSEDPDDFHARNRSALQTELTAVRQNGYALTQRPRRFSNQSALAVPVLTPENNRIVASLSIRFSETAIKEQAALEKFLPRLRATAENIGASVAMPEAVSLATVNSEL